MTYVLATCPLWIGLGLVALIRRESRARRAGREGFAGWVATEPLERRARGKQEKRKVRA